MLLQIWLLVWKINSIILVRNVFHGFEYSMEDSEDISEFNRTMIYFNLEALGKSNLITYCCDCFMNPPPKINTLKYLHSCGCPEIEMSISVLHIINNELTEGGTLIMGIEE